MTLLRLLAIILLLTAPGLVAAEELELPKEVTGDVGRFVSVPVKASGGDRLELQLPAALQLVSLPDLENGQALINLLVTKQADAGESFLTVRLYDGDALLGEGRVRLKVRVQGGLELRTPPGDTVVDGEEVRYTLIVNNTGNSSDTVRLEVRSSLNARLEPEVLSLAARESRSATLILETEGSSSDVALVTATSGLDPRLSETAVIRTTVLPFAGADAIDGPALAYNLEVSAGYGSDRADYRVNAQLNGSLSEFVDLGSALNFENEQLSGSVGLSGNDWSVTYQGVDRLQRLEGRYGAFQGFFATLLGESYSGGFAYEDGPLNLSLMHRSAGEQSDTFRARYRFDVDPTLTLTPSFGLSGNGLYARGAYRVRTSFGLSASLNNEAVSGSSRFQITLPYEALAPWRFDLAVSSRLQDPVGVGGELSLSADELRARVSVRETVSDELRLTQDLSYSGDLGFERTRYSLRFGVGYRPFALPLNLSGSALAGLDENVFDLGYSLSASYQWNALGLSAAISQLSLLNEPAALRYGVGLAYRHLYIDVDAAYQHGEDSDLVLLGVGGEYEGFEGSLQSGYDFRTRDYLLRTELAYAISARYSLFAGASLDDEGLSVRAGGTIRLGGGFATPDGVIDFFGGRAVGIIEGHVFHDLNRNGMREGDEPFLDDLSVSAGNVTTDIREGGSYRLVLAPGSYSLSLGNLPADLALRDVTRVELEQDATLSLDLALETVVGFTGLIIDDSNRNGTFEDDEAKLAYVRTVLTDPSGFRQTALSDDRGNFFFQGLKPGQYTLALDASSLPEGYERTTDALELELKPGPFPRVTLGATAKPKEVSRSLSADSLTLLVEARPNPAAPGTNLEVTAKVQGKPDEVTARIGDDESALEPLDEETFRGRVMIPEDAVGVAALKVVATRGDGARAEQQSLVIIDPSRPLADLQLSSAFVDPGEAIDVDVEFFKDVATTYVVIGETRHPLEALGNLRFSGVVAAPSEAGSYDVELWADGDRVLSTRIRVDDRETQTP